jgi:hypothetical protein
MYFEAGDADATASRLAGLAANFGAASVAGEAPICTAKSAGRTATDSAMGGSDLGVGRANGVREGSTIDITIDCDAKSSSDRNWDGALFSARTPTDDGIGDA